jgi:glutamate--cysteine ligase
MDLDDSPIIENRDQLVSLLEQGCKPKASWRIGTEHEKFGFHLADLRPLAYDEIGGIRQVLEGLARFGWERVIEDGHLIALKLDDGCTVTLEPGGQLELSGAPVESIHQTCNEVNTHLTQVKTVAKELGIGFIGVGFHPLARQQDIPWMPKQRYRIMRRYMPQVGGHGLDMMLRTCTVQVNLDFDSEADMVKKFRVALALQPIATALFANSPFTEGRPNGHLSYRSEVWRDTDPGRTGMLPFVFEPGMGFERWVDYMLEVPMYFVHRNNQYIDAAGQSFASFIQGKLPALPGQRPTIADWQDHLTTVFPEVRLKTFLEMRGADGGPWRRLCALPAFWVGLLYDDVALDAAWELVKDWSAEQRQGLRDTVPSQGLRARVGDQSLLEVAGQALDISHSGLHRRARLNAAGDDETGFLTTLQEIVDTGQTPAERKLKLYHETWDESVESLFEEYAY